MPLLDRGDQFRGRKQGDQAWVGADQQVTRRDGKNEQGGRPDDVAFEPADGIRELIAEQRQQGVANMPSRFMDRGMRLCVRGFEILAGLGVR